MSRTLYDKIICQLVDAWARTEVSDQLREHLILFKPMVINFHSHYVSPLNVPFIIQVYPAIYSWVTFGINGLQKQIYRHEVAALQRNQRISPYRLEFLAALERTEAFAHTGNAKVLSHIVMKPLFITRGLLQHGMPTINKAIFTPAFQDVSPLMIQEDIWPLNRSHTGPAICSKRSQILTYGETSFMVSEYHILFNQPPHIAPIRSALFYS